MGLIVPPCSLSCAALIDLIEAWQKLCVSFSNGKRPCAIEFDELLG